MDTRKTMYQILGAVAAIVGGLYARSKAIEVVETIEVDYLGREPLNPPAE